MSYPTGKERQADIIRLTKAAVEAAQAGRWDIVIQCYRDRGVLLESVQAPIPETGDILKLDEQVRDRVTTAQAVLASLLGQTTATKLRLQGFRQRFVGLPSAPESVSVHT